MAFHHRAQCNAQNAVTELGALCKHQFARVCEATAIGCLTAIQPFKLFIVLTIHYVLHWSQ